MAKELTDEELEAEALAELPGGSDDVEPQPEPKEDIEDLPAPGGSPDEEVVETPEEEPQAVTGEEDLPKDEEPEPAEDHVVEEEGQKESEPSEDDYGIELKKPVKIKARGMEIDITNPEELVVLAHKGFDYFKKTQELAQWRKDISVIEKGGLTTEELQVLAELKNGNKEAATALLKAYGVDPYELQTEETPTGFQPSDKFAPASEVELVAQEILSQPELAEKVKQTVSAVPQDFTQKVSSDPNLLRAFADHVRTGIAEQIIPEAMKRQMMYGGNFFDHYTEVGEALIGGSKQQVEEPPVQPQTKELSDKERRLRQKAAPPKGKPKRQSFIRDAEEIWDLSDEEFDALVRSGKLK